MNKDIEVLYIGNKLSLHNKNVTSIETLGNLLKEKFKMTYSSSKNNKIIRLLDMVSVTLKGRKTYNIVLIDTYSTLNFYFAVIIGQLCRILRIPYIPILRGGDLPSRFERSPALTSMLFKHSKVNVVPSPYLINDMKKRNFSYELIPNSIDIKEYKFLDRDQLQPRLLFVRSLHEIYNPLMGIKVLSILKDVPNVCLGMIGPDKDGSLKKILSLAEKLGVKDKLVIYGYRNKREWRQIAKDYDIFINTTNKDNTPVSVIEAMALGLPVISTNVGGIPYLLNNNVNGILVEKDDHLSMAKEILKLVENPLLAKEIASNARKEAEKFDWEHIKKTWFEVIGHCALKY